MVRPFEILDVVFGFFEVGKSHIPGLDDEAFPRGALGSCESQPQISVYHLLEGFTGLAGFLFQQGRHVIIQRESSSHIMMLYLEAS